MKLLAFLFFGRLTVKNLLNACLIVCMIGLSSSAIAQSGGNYRGVLPTDMDLNVGGQVTADHQHDGTVKVINAYEGSMITVVAAVVVSVFLGRLAYQAASVLSEKMFNEQLADKIGNASDRKIKKQDPIQLTLPDKKVK
jgi:hypothetical protein